VVTVDDLADQAVDDLIDIEGMTEERAAALIMAARAPMIEQLEKGG
jgi:N utilization substance protein A